MNIPVVAVNVYSVPKDKEEEFLTWWHEMKRTIIEVPGFIKGRLHRSLETDAEFNFINVAEWQNSLYSQRYEESVRPMKAKLAELGIQARPAMFGIYMDY
jgi:heme oxygenase (mycobilin-producing)